MTNLHQDILNAFRMGVNISLNFINPFVNELDVKHKLKELMVKINK